MMSLIQDILEKFNSDSLGEAELSEEYETNERGGAIHELYQARTLRCVFCGKHVAKRDPFLKSTRGAGIAPGVESVIDSGGLLFCPEHKGGGHKVCVHGVFLENPCEYCPDDTRIKTIGQLRRLDESSV